MFKTTESSKKGTLPEPLGVLKLKGEKNWRDFFKVYIGKVITKVSDKEYQFVDGAYYQIAKDKYVCSTDCEEVMYHAQSYVSE